MAELLTDCPRCGANKTTFDLKSVQYITTQFNWKEFYETFCICRHCSRGTIFVLSQKHIEYGIAELAEINANINDRVEIERYINIKENSTDTPPEHLPDNIHEVFLEGITCKSVECFNASGTMFRLCLDMATKDLLPKEETEGLNAKIRRSLGLRLEWLINNDIIHRSLEELAKCIKDDGNDGAHEGILSKVDLEDIYDFTSVLLERLYTEPKQIELAQERRVARRSAAN